GACRAAAAGTKRAPCAAHVRAAARVRGRDPQHRGLLPRGRGPLHRGNRDGSMGMTARDRVDTLRAPLFVSWQPTRASDLCCLHCCTESAPGKRMRDELDEWEAMRVVREIVRNDVPYVMLCGGEPLVVAHFLAVAEALGEAGVQLKIETN